MNEQVGRELRMQVNLPVTQEVGVYADFANVWNTPNTFIIDFMSVAQPESPALDNQGSPLDFDILQAVISARVRIAPEQIFMLADALNRQGKAWLAATGRRERPEAWMVPRENDGNN
jgi:hypothetical protein